MDIHIYGHPTQCMDKHCSNPPKAMMRLHLQDGDEAHLYVCTDHELSVGVALSAAFPEAEWSKGV